MRMAAAPGAIVVTAAAAMETVYDARSANTVEATEDKGQNLK